jgi:flagellar motor switch protein FliN
MTRSDVTSRPASLRQQEGSRPISLLEDQQASNETTTENLLQIEADLQQMDSYADLPMELDAELDRRSIAVRDLLSLAPGSVIKLTRSAGDNVDVRVNGARIGFGEIIILESKVGVRMTDFDEI